MFSDLTSVVQLSPNHSGPRTNKVDRITPHCFVAKVTAERALEVFMSEQAECSANYVIGEDGRIGGCVDEDNRSWCSSSNENDQRAVTIECSSDNHAPFEFSEPVYRSLITLCIDICRRFGKTRLLWISDKERSLAYEPKDDEMIVTVHSWFADKSCPGEWFMSHMDEFVAAVNAGLQQ